jgi:serine/threonine-protein kinase
MNKPPSAQAARLVGGVISERYLVQALIAESPQGALYRGEHAHMRKRIAVKVLYPEAARRPDALARFEREAIAGANIDHPNVAAAKDFGALEDGTRFLVMEYLEGKTLREVMRAPLPLDRAIGISRQIALGLDAAHGTGIVHRALSPETIWLVSRGGAEDVVKLVDFGAARLPPSLLSGEGPAFEERAQRVSIPVGPSPERADYASPEQLGLRALDGRSDLYALGVILYEMLSGQRPGHEEAPRRLSLLCQVPPALEALVERLLARSPAARPATALEVADALGALAASATFGPDPALAPGPAPLSSPAALLMTAAGSSTPDRTSAPLGASGALPRSILQGVAGAIAIVVIVVVAIAVRSTPMEDDADASPRREPGSEQTSARGDDQGAKRGGDDGDARPEPSGSARELRAQLAREVHGGKYKTAVGTLASLLSSDPRAPEDGDVRSDIVDLATKVAFTGGADADRLFDMIATKMGTNGADILFYIATAKGGSEAARRAEALLADEGVRKRGTPALRISYELRKASCADKPALFDRARDEGDGRTLGQLRSVGRECGLSKDSKLKEAIDALKARLH